MCVIVIIFFISVCECVCLHIGKEVWWCSCSCLVMCKQLLLEEEDIETGNNNNNYKGKCLMITPSSFRCYFSSFFQSFFVVSRVFRSQVEDDDVMYAV